MSTVLSGPAYLLTKRLSCLRLRLDEKWGQAGILSCLLKWVRYSHSLPETIQMALTTKHFRTAHTTPVSTQFDRSLRGRASAPHPSHNNSYFPTGRGNVKVAITLFDCWGSELLHISCLNKTKKERLAWITLVSHVGHSRSIAFSCVCVLLKFYTRHALLDLLQPLALAGLTVTESHSRKYRSSCSEVLIN